jgi:hypothetical protein
MLLYIRALSPTAPTGDTQSDRELIPHPQIFARITRATTPAIKFHATSGCAVSEYNNEE